MLDEYYHSELAYYRMLAQEYARKFEEVEHLVSERRGDSSVERVVQGAALLTARLRARLDDDFPEIIHSLFEAMWPQYLRPEPAVTLLQFRPRANVLRQSQTIPGGTEVESEPVEGVECPFRTTSSVDLLPLRITEARLHQPEPSNLQLRLAVEMLGGVMFDNVKLRSIRIHLLGDHDVRYVLYHWLCHHCAKVSIEGGKEGDEIVLPRGSVTPVGFSPEEHLFPGQATLLPGLRYLEEYFAFPDKFLGVDVGGVNLVPGGRIEGEFELVFHLGMPPDANLKISDANFGLGCAPVINLSAKELVEVQVEPGINEYRLQAPRKGEVHSLVRVGAHDTRTNEWIDYPPLHGGERRKVDVDRPRYQLHRRSDGIERVETYLAITDAAGQPMVPPAEALHVEMIYTDGNRPLRLGIGEVSVATSSSPEYCEFSNIVGVSSPSSLSVSKERHWELLALFSMHPADLISKNGLRRLIQSCFEARSVGGGMPRVLDVTRAIGSRLHRQTVVPVTEVTVTVDGDLFVIPGELYLFARVISRVLLDRPEDLAFTEVTVKSTTGQSYHFAQ